METKHIIIGLVIFILIGIGIFKLGGLLIGSQEGANQLTEDNSPPQILLIEEIKDIAEDANNRNQSALDSLQQD